jgi:hypothetical protein
MSFSAYLKEIYIDVENPYIIFWFLFEPLLILLAVYLSRVSGWVKTAGRVIFAELCFSCPVLCAVLCWTVVLCWAVPKDLLNIHWSSVKGKAKNGISPLADVIALNIWCFVNVTYLTIAGFHCYFFMNEEYENASTDVFKHNPEIEAIFIIPMLAYQIFNTIFCKMVPGMDGA